MVVIGEQNHYTNDRLISKKERVEGLNIRSEKETSEMENCPPLASDRQPLEGNQRSEKTKGRNSATQPVKGVSFVKETMIIGEQGPPRSLIESLTR